MKELAALGADAYSRPSEPLDYIKALIESQAADGADYIAVNLDAFGEADPQAAVGMMVEYVRLVRQYGQGVPVCIDSSDNNVLIAGLKEWCSGAEAVGQPLVNSVKVYTMGRMLPLKKDFDYAFVGLLVSEEAATAPGGSHSVDELYALARRIFEKAVGYTYRAFETIGKIKGDPTMQGVHCSLGVSNCARDLPARKVGICRAYVAKAMEYGLDAGIVNTAHRFGETDPAPELLELVDAYAKMDGSPEPMMRAMDLMGQFCRDSRG